MPRIPGRSREDRIPSRVAQTAVSQLGVTDRERQLGQIGEQLASLGTELAQRQKRNSDAIYASNRMLQDMREASEEVVELKRQMPEDPRGFTQALRSRFNERMAEGQRNAPSETARLAYVSRAREKFNKMLIEAQIWEDEVQRQNHMNFVTDQVTSFRNTLLENPNPGLAIEAFNNIEDTLAVTEGTLFSERENAERAEEALRGLRDSVLTGLLMGGEENEAYIRRGLGLLNLEPDKSVKMSAKEALENGLINQKTFQKLNRQGKDFEVGVMPATLRSDDDTDAQLMEGITTTELEAWKKRFKEAEEKTNRFSLRNIRKMLGDIHNAEFRGQGASRNLYKAYVNEVKKIEDPQIKAEMLGNAAIEGAAGEIFRRMQNQHPRKWDEEIAQFEQEWQKFRDDIAQQVPGNPYINDPAFMGTEVTQKKELLRRQGRKILEARREDAAAFVLRNGNANLNDLFNQIQDFTSASPQEMQSFFRTMVAKQKELGIAPQHRRLIPKSLARRWSSLISRNNEATNTERVAGLVSQMERKAGSFWGALTGHLAVDDDFVEMNPFVTWVKDQRVRQRVMNIVRNRPEIEKAFKDADLGSTDAVIAKVSSRWAGVLDSIERSGSPFADNLGKANSLRDLLNVYAMDILRQSGNGITDIDTAVEQAGRDILPPVVNGGNSTIVIPWQGVDVNARDVEKFVGYYSEAENFKQLGAWPHERVMEVLTKQRGLSRQDAVESFYEALEDSSQWRLVRPGNRIQLMATINGQTFNVRDKQGNPIDIELTEIDTSSNDPRLQGVNAYEEPGRLEGFIEGVGDFFEDLF